MTIPAVFCSFASHFMLPCASFDVNCDKGTKGHINVGGTILPHMHELPDGGQRNTTRRVKFDKMPNRYASANNRHGANELITAICIEGGGVKGIAYGGAVSALEENGVILRPPGLSLPNRAGTVNSRLRRAPRPKRTVLDFTREGLSIPFEFTQGKETGEAGQFILPAEDPDDPHIVRQYAGASAGSIQAALLALGFTAGELSKITSNTPYKDFQDGTIGYCCFNSVCNVWRALTEFGLYKGDYIEGYLNAIFEEKTGIPDITFAQAYEWSRGKSADGKKGSKGTMLRMPVSNLATNSLEWLDHRSTPDIKLATGCKLSSCLPGVFKPMRMNLGRRDGIYVDGGLLKNLPGDAFAQKNMDGSFNTLEAKFDLNRVQTARMTLCLNLVDDIELKLQSGVYNGKADEGDCTTMCTNICLPACCGCFYGKCCSIECAALTYLSLMFDTMFHNIQNHPNLKKPSNVHCVNIYSGHISAADFDISADDILVLLTEGNEAIDTYFNGGPYKGTGGSYGGVDVDASTKRQRWDYSYTDGLFLKPLFD